VNNCYEPDTDQGWFVTAVIALVLLFLMWAGGCMEVLGVEREPTAKSKLCACVIQVDSVPIPEDILEVG